MGLDVRKMYLKQAFFKSSEVDNCRDYNSTELISK